MAIENPKFGELFIQGLEIPEAALAQIVSINRRGQLQTLGDFIASRSPIKTLREFNIKRSRKHVRRIDELTDEEARKVVAARLEQTPADIKWGFLQH